MFSHISSHVVSFMSTVTEIKDLFSSVLYTVNNNNRRHRQNVFKDEKTANLDQTLTLYTYIRKHIFKIKDGKWVVSLEMINTRSALSYS